MEKITLLFFCFVQVSFASTSSIKCTEWQTARVGIDLEKKIKDPIIDIEHASNHASYGLTYLMLKNGQTIKINRIGQCQAKGKQNPIPENIVCRHSESVAGGPRLHSEIAYLQELTRSDNPKDAPSIFNYLDYPINEIYEIQIYIKNALYIPCSTQAGDDGIPCQQYIKQFCQEIAKKGAQCKVYVGVFKKGKYWWQAYSAKP